MHTLNCAGRSFDWQDGQTVLDVLLAAGLPVQAGCRSGICQSCLVRAVSGKVPEAAQRGLSSTLRAGGYLLACSCRPEGDLEVTLEDLPQRRLGARIRDLSPLGPDVIAVSLEAQASYPYLPGQYLRLYRPDGVSRCYSIASVPGIESTIDLHVRRIPGGSVSAWLHDEARAGEAVEISEPMGACHYVAGEPLRPLLLVGSGCGLAPLYGIVRDALRQGHAGPIRLYHGSRSPSGLYLVDALTRLAREHGNFTYQPCVAGEPGLASIRPGEVLQAALSDHADLSAWRIFLCGSPDMVRSGQREAYLAGASLAAIHADPFLPS